MEERKAKVKLRITPVSGETFDVSVSDEWNSRSEAEQIARNGTWDETAGIFYSATNIASVQVVAAGQRSLSYIGGQIVDLRLEDDA